MSKSTWESSAFDARDVITSKLVINIENFSFCEPEYSNTFPLNAGEEVEYQWEVTIRSSTYYDKLEISLGLLRAPGNISNRPIRYSVIVLDEEKSAEITHADYHVMQLAYDKWSDRNNYKSLKLELCKRSFILERSKFLPNDKLTVLVEITTPHSHGVIKTSTPKDKSSTPKGKSTPSDMAKERLIDDYKLLYKTKESSDIILVIGSKEIRAHKSILAARSPVFQAMFNNTFREARSRRVEIKDIDPNVLEEVVHFIYTAACPNIEKWPIEILEAADKYDIGSLKLLCEEVLAKEPWSPHEQRFWIKLR